MDSLDKQYTNLLQDILDNGVKKQDRTGTGTLSVFGRQIRHKMSGGFPVITTKKIYFKGVVTELLWFLQGRTDLRYLLENDCHIWTGDAYKVYDKDFDAEWPPFSGPYPPRLTVKEFEERIMTDDDFNKMYGDLGPIYGKQWRKWRGSNGMISEKDEDGVRVITWNRIDQIANLINDLKTNPDSRRLMVTAWNPAELNQMTLPPCHYGFQVYTRELSYNEREQLALSYPHIKKLCDVNGPMTPKGWDDYNIPTRAISLMWNQRSIDTFLGLPFNVASYGLLLEIIAKAVNMVPDELVGNLGDTHLYLDHIEQAKEQIGRELTLKERYKLWPNKDNEFAKKTYNSTTDKEFKHGFLSSRHQGSVPRRTREPYPLPELKHMKTDEFYKSLSEDVSLFTHLDNTDFEIEGYQSHPHIKAPLSN